MERIVDLARVVAREVVAVAKVALLAVRTRTRHD